MNTLYSWAAHDLVSPFIERDIDAWRSAGFNITSFNHREILGVDHALKPLELEERYRTGDPGLLELYRRVRSQIEDNDVFIVDNENVYHPEFLQSLEGVYKVLVSADDPEGSFSSSKPWVKYFDHVFAWGVNYDADSLITEKFVEWGARRADLWPHGVREDMFSSSLTEEGIATGERDIDLVFIGTPTLKVSRLTALKAAFPQLEIYGRDWSRRAVLADNRVEHGRWNWRSAVGSVRALMLGMGDIQSLPMDQLVGLYQRTKIGVNVHMSYGPSNVRTFQIPANGMMQVCDDEDGLSHIYDLNNEVVGYKSMSDAIDKIRYYLDHDDERKQVAIRGFRRTMSDYRRVDTFKNTMMKIEAGISSNGA